MPLTLAGLLRTEKSMSDKIKPVMTPVKFLITKYIFNFFFDLQTEK